MKKYLLILMFLAVSEVNALEIKNVYYRKDIDGICDEDNKYPIYVMKYRQRAMYFLNLSTSYNLNFEDYYLIDFEDSPYNEDIKYFAASDIYSGEKDYNRAIHRLLWEKLYPDKKFDMCQYNSYDIKEQENYYNEVKDKIYSIYDGPKFTDAILYLEENKSYEYEYAHLKYFEIIDWGNLNVQINDTKLLVSGPKGKHQIKFKRKVTQEGFTDILYTDGTNYLLWYPKVIDKEYIVDIIIGQNEVVLTLVDENDNSLNNMSVLINEVIYHTDENGKINIETFEDELSIKVISNGEYEIYESVLNLKDNHNFKITLTKNEIEENELVIPNEEMVIINPEDSSKDNIVIEVEDTFIFSKVYLLIFALGILYAKYNQN